MTTASATIPTPLGLAFAIEATDDTITLGEFRRARPDARKPRDPLLREAAAQINAYFARRLGRFDLPVSYRGTYLQLAAWDAVRQLAFGDFASYADVARAINRPHAHRGVAAAMAKTPVDLLIPAHRVLGSDGRLRGCGPRSIRARLLRFERRALDFVRVDHQNGALIVVRELV